MSSISDLSNTDRNPIQETEYQQLLKQAGIPFTVNGGKASINGYGVGGNGAQAYNPAISSSGGAGGDVVANAQKLLDFQKTANAPVSAALGSQVPGIQDEYTNLVNSIKGNQTLDTNRQTTTTNNLLAQRGITSNSGVGQQEMTNALTPIDTQYSGLLANANQGSIQDLQGLALQIANLNAGNPETAIPNALNYGNVLNTAAQTAAGIQQAQIYGNAQVAAAQAHPYTSTSIPGVTLNSASGSYSTTGLAQLIASLNNL